MERKFSNCNLRYADYAVERLDTCMGSVHTLVEYLSNGLQDSLFTPQGSQHIMFYKGQLEKLSACLQQIAHKWQSYKDTLDASERPLNAYRVVAIPTGAKGRPKFQIITQEQLEDLCFLSFSWSDIAMLLGISRITLFRYRREFNMIDNPQQSLSDNQLRTTITQLRLEMPSVGETMLMGHFRSRGYNVTRERLRVAIHATDPINTTLCWKGNLHHCCPYSVPGPNSLWYIGKHILCTLLYRGCG